jgi:DNA-3-methyladenine glycosylase I
MHPTASPANYDAIELNAAIMTTNRCAWASVDNPLMLEYHDREWGVPVHNDRKHFEFLVLSGAQAGLNFSVVLKKREGYRRAFDSFDPEKVAHYSEARIQKLRSDLEIIRNRMKIEAAVRNARAFLKTQEEFGDFDSYCWRFVGGRPKLNRWKATGQIPATSPESDAFSKDLKQRGFSFVGSTVVYAYMQSVGMVNDHLVDCFRYREIKQLWRTQIEKRKGNARKEEADASHPVDEIR